MNHIQEEKIVDYVLDHLENEERKKVHVHVSHCKKCEQLLNQWQLILRKEEKVIRSNDSIKGKLEKTMKKKRIGKNRRTSYAAIGSIVAACFLTIVFLQSYKQSTSISNYDVVQNDDIPIETIEWTRYTDQLHIIPVTDDPNVTGHVLVNNKTNEMLLEVNGLQLLQKQDYQLWIIYTDDHVDGEIIPVQNGSTRMFFKGIPIDHFKKVKATVEPLGGSKEQTGPETFFIEF